MGGPGLRRLRLLGPAHFSQVKTTMLISVTFLAFVELSRSNTGLFNFYTIIQLCRSNSAGFANQASLESLIMPLWPSARPIYFRWKSGRPKVFSSSAKLELSSAGGFTTTLTAHRPITSFDDQHPSLWASGPSLLVFLIFAGSGPKVRSRAVHGPRNRHRSGWPDQGRAFGPSPLWPFGPNSPLPNEYLLFLGGV